MRGWRIPTCLLAFLLVAFPALAGPAHPITLLGTSFDAEGNLALDATAEAFWMIDSAGELPAGDFTLVASALNIQTQRADGAYVLGNKVNPTPEQESATYTAALVQGSLSKVGATMDIVGVGAGPHLSLSGSCIEATSSAEATVAIEPKVNPASYTGQRNVSDSIAIGLCGSAEIVFRGDFVLALWEWDAQLSSNEGTRLVESGFKATTPQAPAAAGNSQQQYLHVKGGEFRMPFYPKVEHRFYLREHNLTMDGEGRLTEASATIEGKSPVSSAEIRLAGHGVLQMSPANGQLRAEPSGNLTLTANGATLYQPVGAVAVDVGSELPWLPAAALAFVLLVAAWFLPVIVGRRFAARYNESALMHPRARAFFWSGLSLAASNRDQGRLSQFFAWRAIRNTPIGKEALIARARANYAIGRLEAEITDHEILHHVLVLDRERAANAVQAAKTLLELGNKAEALAWLKLAWKECPNVVNQHIASPALAMLRNDPWVRMQENAWWYYT